MERRLYLPYNKSSYAFSSMHVPASSWMPQDQDPAWCVFDHSTGHKQQPHLFSSMPYRVKSVTFYHIFMSRQPWHRRTAPSASTHADLQSSAAQHLTATPCRPGVHSLALQVLSNICSNGFTQHAPNTDSISHVVTPALCAVTCEEHQHIVSLLVTAAALCSTAATSQLCSS